MVAWASPEDILDDWIGDDLPDNPKLLERWISRAQRLIRREFPAISERIAAGEPDLAENVRDVIVSMVTRVLRNPEGIRSRSETDGSFTGSITFGGDNPGGLVLTDEERRTLTPPEQRGKSGAYSVHVGGRSYSVCLPWCDSSMYGLACSCGASIAGVPIYETRGGGYA